MTGPAELAIIGVGQTPYRRRHEGSTPELVRGAVRAALDHSGLGHRDIDLVIGGFAPDALAGENCPDKRFLPAAGAVGRWSMRVNTGGTTGRIETFTILATKFHGLPDPPAVIGYVTLDGASTAILNYVQGVPLDDLDAAGKQLLGQPRVRVRFHPQPEGRITDFHFEVTDDPA